MKNLHLLPTEKPSRLFDFMTALVLLKKASPNDSGTNQNIYITSDEEIKVGDYWIYICPINGLDYGDNNNPIVKNNLLPTWFKKLHDKGNYKKIILTTDQDLIADNVQAIDDEFLEWFVNNPSCESVETIYGLFNPMGRQVDPNNLGQNHSQCIWKHKIIIPQEEPKQDYIGIHLRHCYQGEYEDGCKYGEDDCSAKPLEEPKQETIMKQTALNWLETRVEGREKNNPNETAYWHLRELQKDFEKAKIMEKQQIIFFTDNYVDNCVIPNENMAIPTIMDVPQYYNKTFKNK
jgi:hypothetical protein